MARFGQMPQTLIKLATGGLVLLACFFLVKAVMIWLNPQSAWIAPPAAATSTADPRQNTTAPKLDYNFDPFHRGFEANVPDAPIFNPDDDVADTSLNLKLKGTTVPDQAIIEGTDRKQKSYGIGDEISNGVALDSVHHGYVILLRDGNREKLSLERTESGLGGAQPAVSAGSPGFRASGSFNAANLLQQVSIVPHKNENNRLVGYKVSGKPGFDIKKLGFRNGDVVTKIGSQDLTSPGIDIATTVMSAVAAGKPTAQILRRGRKMTIRIRVP